MTHINTKVQTPSEIHTKSNAASRHSVLNPLVRATQSVGVAAVIAGLAAASQAQAQSPSPVFTNLWSIVSGTLTPNDLPSLGTANNVRGVAINPKTTNVVFASTTAGTNNGNNHITVLDYTNSGVKLGQTSGSGISGGTLNLTQVRVSADGYIYACNLSGSPASVFKIYRWPSDSDFVSAPTTVFANTSGASFQWRIGDYMDLRGSGINTEIVVGGNGSGANVTTNFVIFKATDDTATTFTNFSITIPGVASSIIGGGITFEGTNNVLWVKAASGKPVYRVTYNPTNLTASIVATFQMDQAANNGLKYYETGGIRMLATVCTASTALTNGIQHYAKVMQLTDNSNAVIVLNQPLPTPNQANGNVLGLVDFQNGRAVFSEPNNGISLYTLGFVTNTPAVISEQPAGATVVETYNYTFTVSASGTTPRKFQWYFASATATNALLNQTNTSLVLMNLKLSDAGGYFATVTNAYGGSTSSVATLTILPAGFSSVASQLWTVSAGSRNYLTTDHTQRGMTCDPVTGNLVLISRSPTNGVHLLSSTNGADLGEMDISYMGMIGNPGTYPINMVAAADDGAVYAINLITSATTDNLAIYRWNSAATTEVQGIAYYGNPGAGRLGDTFAAKGAGADTVLIAAVRTGTNVVVFTGDGYNFSPSIISITNLPADAQANGFAGLGLACGSGNTFWAKSTGFRLRRVEYDLASLTGWVTDTYDAPETGIGPIGVDYSNGLMAGLGVVQVPQNLSFWNLNAFGAPLVDREFFPSNNGNANGTGAVAFNVGAGHVYALDSNNGIMALNYAPPLGYQVLDSQLVLKWTGPAFLQSATDVTGPYSTIGGASSPYTNNIAPKAFYRLIR